MGIWLLSRASSPGCVVFLAQAWEWFSSFLEFLRRCAALRADWSATGRCPCSESWSPRRILFRGRWMAALRTTATVMCPVPWAFLRLGIAGALSAVPPSWATAISISEGGSGSGAVRPRCVRVSGCEDQRCCFVIGNGGRILAVGHTVLNDEHLDVPNSAGLRFRFLSKRLG